MRRTLHVFSLMLAGCCLGFPAVVKAVTWTGDVEITSNTIIDDNVVLDNASVMVYAGVTLEITGELQVTGNSTLSMAQFAILEIDEKLEIKPGIRLDLSSGPDTNITVSEGVENKGEFNLLFGPASSPGYGLFYVGGNFEMDGAGDIRIREGCILQIAGRLEMKSQFPSIIAIESDAEIIVEGDVEVFNESEILISEGGDGTLNESLEVKLNGQVIVHGYLTILGDMEGTPPYAFAGNGCVWIGGTGCVFWTGDCPCNSVLPVELLAFDARAAAQAIELSWSTATEINNDFFTLERSVDGIHFDVIATVAGSGTTKETSQYKYTDQTPLLGIAYYRLSQIDFDGTHEVLGVRAVNFIPADASFSIFPNPLRDSRLLLQAAGLSSGREATFRITDLTGRTVYELSFFPELEAINQEVEIAAPLRRGFYLAEIHQSDHRFTQKLVVE